MFFECFPYVFEKIYVFVVFSRGFPWFSEVLGLLRAPPSGADDS